MAMRDDYYAVYSYLDGYNNKDLMNLLQAATKKEKTIEEKQLELLEQISKKLDILLNDKEIGEEVWKNI